MAGWRSELAGCRSTLSMSKRKVKISETKYRSFYKTLVRQQREGYVVIGWADWYWIVSYSWLWEKYLILIHENQTLDRGMIQEDTGLYKEAFWSHLQNIRNIFLFEKRNVIQEVEEAVNSFFLHWFLCFRTRVARRTGKFVKIIQLVSQFHQLTFCPLILKLFSVKTLH